MCSTWSWETCVPDQTRSSNSADHLLDSKSFASISELCLGSRKRPRHLVPAEFSFWPQCLWIRKVEFLFLSCSSLATGEGYLAGMSRKPLGSLVPAIHSRSPDQWFEFVTEEWGLDRRTPFGTFFGLPGTCLQVDFPWQGPLFGTSFSSLTGITLPPIGLFFFHCNLWLAQGCEERINRTLVESLEALYNEWKPRSFPIIFLWVKWNPLLFLGPVDLSK